MSITLISIPDVLAFHLVGTATLPLTPSPATLSLVRIDAPSQSHTLQVGALAFPLSKSTDVGTQAGNLRGFFLKPDLPDAEGVSGWVKLELSQESVDNGSSLELEEHLVEGGWLLDSKVEAGADEVGAGIKEAGIQRKFAISAASDAYVERTPQVDHPKGFSSFTHKLASSASAATAAVENVTHMVAGTVLSAAGSVGEWVGGKLGAVAPSSVAVDEDGESSKAGEASGLGTSFRGGLQSAANAVSSVAEGVSTGSSQVYNETTSALHARIEHSHGPEASELSGQAGQTAEALGGVAKDVLLATSVVVVGGIAADGVRRGASAEQKN